jgi:hypothetical protein
LPRLVVVWLLTAAGQQGLQAVLLLLLDPAAAAVRWLAALLL